MSGKLDYLAELTWSALGIQRSRHDNCAVVNVGGELLANISQHVDGAIHGQQSHLRAQLSRINITPGSGHRWTSKKAEPRSPADAQLALVLDTIGIAYGPDACPSYQAERTARHLTLMEKCVCPCDEHVPARTRLLAWKRTREA